MRRDQVTFGGLARSIGAGAAAALAIAAVAGCGGSSSTATTAAATSAVAQPTTARATQPASPPTATSTRSQPATTQTAAAGTAPAGQVERAVTPRNVQLNAGPVTTSITVTKVADPVVASVDSPAKGDKLVGVFVTTHTGGAIPQAGIAAQLMTVGGKAYPVRVIADGDCGGSFITSGFLEAVRPTNGCVGFEVPKSAKPSKIVFTLGIPTTPDKKGATATGSASVMG